MATSDSPLSVPDITLAVARSAGGGSEPTGAPSISSVTDNGDGTLSISGSNFGAKSRQPPAFVDYGNKAYEVGALNTTHGDNLVDGSPLRGGTEANLLYASGQSDASAVTYRTGGPKRHAAHVASYRTESADSWFGEPKSFTWSGPNNRPNRPRYYQANWFYFPDNPGCMWLLRIPQADIDAGNPIPGEPININGFTGTFAGYEADEEWANIHFDSPFPGNNTNQIGGQTLNFETSGMTFVWPAGKGATAPYNWEAPGFKFARIWPQSDVGTGRVIASLTTNDWYMSGSRSANYTPSKVGNIADLAGGQWHLSEFLVDLNEGWADHKFDGVSRGLQTFDPIDPYENPTSYTMNLWGIDGRAGGTFNPQSVESSYCDDSLHRVLISTAATKADLRIDNIYHYEIQRPESWSNSAVTINFVPGALPSGQTLYAYVFNDANDCNTTGYNIGVTV